MGKDLEVRVCPEGHSIPFIRDAYAKDFSGGNIDVNGLPMYEDGLYCHECDRAYGISKLREPSEELKK